jgi:hypothetical protein
LSGSLVDLLGKRYLLLIDRGESSDVRLEWCIEVGLVDADVAD